MTHQGLLFKTFFFFLKRYFIFSSPSPCSVVHPKGGREGSAGVWISTGSPCPASREWREATPNATAPKTSESRGRGLWPRRVRGATPRPCGMWPHLSSPLPSPSPSEPELWLVPPPPNRVPRQKTRSRSVRFTAWLCESCAPVTERPFSRLSFRETKRGEKKKRRGGKREGGTFSSFLGENCTP